MMLTSSPRRYSAIVVLTTLTNSVDMPFSLEGRNYLRRGKWGVFEDWQLSVRVGSRASSPLVTARPVLPPEGFGPPDTCVAATKGVSSEGRIGHMGQFPVQHLPER